jgi:hypothetical protein
MAEITTLRASNESDLVREQMKSQTTLEKADRDNATRIALENIKQGNENVRKEADIIEGQQERAEETFKEAIKEEKEFQEKIHDKLEGNQDIDRRTLGQ